VEPEPGSSHAKWDGLSNRSNLNWAGGNASFQRAVALGLEIRECKAAATSAAFLGRF